MLGRQAEGSRGPFVCLAQGQCEGSRGPFVCRSHGLLIWLPERAAVVLAIPAEERGGPRLAEHVRGRVPGHCPPALAEARRAAGLAVLGAEGAQGLAEGQAVGEVARARGVHVLPDVRREVHARPHPPEHVVEGGAVRGVHGGGEEAVAHVLVGEAAHARDLGPSSGVHLGGALLAHALADAVEEELEQVGEAREELGGHCLEEERDPLGAEVGRGGGQAEKGDRVGAQEPAALEHQDVHGEVEGRGHGARLGRKVRRAGRTYSWFAPQIDLNGFAPRAVT